MKRAITLVSAAAGLLACVGAVQAQSSQPNSAGQPAGTSNQPFLVTPPPPSVGDTFTYRVGLVRPPVVWTYLGPNGDRPCFSERQAGSETTTVCDRSAAALPSWLRLSFPLFVGKTWEYTTHSNGHLSDHPKSLLHNFEHTVRVTAYEPVTVGAGTFNAFKIEDTSILWGEARIVRPTTLYYSPELGVIKRHSYTAGPEDDFYDTNIELVSYTRAQAATSR